MSAQLLLYGDVGYHFSALSVSKWLQDNPKGDIHIRISSGGGDAWDGLTIYSMLRASGRRVEIDIDGIAASAASVISMAGDVVRMSEAAVFMVHRSWAVVAGNEEQLREQAEVMTKLDGAMLAAYARKTGRPPELIRPLLDKETYMSAIEARDAGFVDHVVDGQKIAAQVRSSVTWEHLPAEVKARLHVAAQPATVDAMDLQQLQEALSAALAPVVARLEKLEAPAPVAQAEEPAAEEPAIEVAPAVTEAQASAESVFAEMVAGAADEFIAAGKLRPEGRELFVAASATPAGFKKACAYFRSAPSAVATEAARLPAIEASKELQLTPAQKEYAERAGLKIGKGSK